MADTALHTKMSTRYKYGGCPCGVTVQNGRTQAHNKDRIGGGRGETGPEPPGPRRGTRPPRSGEAGPAVGRSHTPPAGVLWTAIPPRTCVVCARGTGRRHTPIGVRLPCLLSRVSGRSPGTTAGSLCGRTAPPAPNLPELPSPVRSRVGTAGPCHARGGQPHLRLWPACT